MTRVAPGQTRPETTFFIGVTRQRQEGHPTFDDGTMPRSGPLDRLGSGRRWAVTAAVTGGCVFECRVSEELGGGSSGFSLTTVAVVVAIIVVAVVIFLLLTRR